MGEIGFEASIASRNEKVKKTKNIIVNVEKDFKSMMKSLNLEEGILKNELKIEKKIRKELIKIHKKLKKIEKICRDKGDTSTIPDIFGRAKEEAEIAGEAVKEEIEKQ